MADGALPSSLEECVASIRNILVDEIVIQNDKNYDTLGQISSLQKESLSELETIKLQLGAYTQVGTTEVSKMMSNTLFKLGEIEVLLQSSTTKLQKFNKVMDELEKKLEST